MNIGFVFIWMFDIYLIQCLNYTLKILMLNLSVVLIRNYDVNQAFYSLYLAGQAVGVSVTVGRSDQ